jgi:hypothetical protein
MNCVEAQKHFTDLLDHSREERLRKVNDHLAACARCRQELAAVAACQRFVSALPPVEPPAGFTTRVMAEVRDTAHRPKLWQRLLSPVQIKLPLQATAVVLIGVLAFFIYQKESGQRQSTTTIPPPNGLQKNAEANKLPPAAGRARALKPDTENPEEAGAQKQRVKRSPRTDQARSPAEPAEQAIGDIQPGAPAAGLADAPGRSLAPSKLEKQSSAAGEAASPRREQLSPSEAHTPPSATAVPQFDKHTDYKDTASAGDPSSSVAPAEKRASSSLDALKSGRAVLAFPAGHELTLRLTAPARRDETAAAPLGLQRPQTQPRPSPVEREFKELDQAQQRAIATDQPQTIWVTILASQYEGFKKELAGLGNIESELPAPAHKNEVKPADQLRIKLTILPPRSSADSPSSR